MSRAIRARSSQKPLHSGGNHHARCGGRRRVEGPPVRRPLDACESVCKPDPVVDDHLSGTAVTDGLVRPTRDVADGPSCPCSVLLLTRFAEPRRSLGVLVGSYPTVSPLPVTTSPCGEFDHRRSALCCTVCRVAPPGCYPASCPVESGLSSTANRRDRLTDSPSEHRSRTPLPTERFRWIWASG